MLKLGGYGMPIHNYLIIIEITKIHNMEPYEA